jgi:hypothetical protein
VAPGRELTRAERNEVLRIHPVLAARITEARVIGMFRDVYNGKSKPFGEVTEYWARIEFQARGTPHVHFLLWIKNEGIDFLEPTDMFAPDGSAAWKRVQECVSRTATAWLPNRMPGPDDQETYPTINDLNEQDPSFNPEFGQLYKCHF